MVSTLARIARIAAVTAAALGAAAAAAGLVYGKGSPRFLLCRLAFDHYLRRDAAELDREARSGSSSVYYFTSYYLNGMLSAVEATHDERLLRRTLDTLDLMVDRARPFEANGRSYRVWGPFTVTADSSRPKPILHYTFQAMVPVARAAAVIRADPEWSRRYGARADHYADFARQCVLGYFYREELQGRIPWLDPERFPLWNDNASNLALNAAFLCRAGAPSETCDVADAVGRAFKAKLTHYGAGWIWENQTIPIGSDTDNTPGSVGNQAGVPDTSHTNREAFLMLTLWEMGRIFSRADVERMAATFTDTLWNGSLEDPSFANYLNGSDLPYRVYKEPGLNGSVYHGWALMGAVSPRAQDVLLATLLAAARGRANPSLERNTTSYGAVVALAGHALRNFKSLDSEAGRMGGSDASQTSRGAPTTDLSGKTDKTLVGAAKRRPG